MNVVVLCSIDILNKTPSVYEAFKCLKKMSALWDDIARELNIEWNDRQQIHEQSISSNRKLETVLHKWQERKTCDISWQKLIDVLNELNRTDIIDDVKTFLGQHV